MEAKYWTGLLLIGVMGVAGCGGSSGTSDAASGEAAKPGSTPGAALVAGETLFSDPFDDDRNGWGIIDDPTYGSTSYVDGDYVWAFRGSVAHWLPEVLGEQYDLGELDMLDVVVRAEATIDKGDGVIGVFCRESPDTDAEWQWYEFVARDRYAAIRLADQEGNIDVLAETEDVSLPSGEPVVIEAVCANDAAGVALLALRVNGEAVLDVSEEDPLGNGVSGLQAWTFPVHEQMDIRWHEFTVGGVSR